MCILPLKIKLSPYTETENAAVCWGPNYLTFFQFWPAWLLALQDTFTSTITELPLAEKALTFIKKTKLKITSDTLLRHGELTFP